MQVFINEQAVTVYSGCKAADAVRRLEANRGTQIPYTELYDAWGNVIADDSPMSEGRHIFTYKPTTR